ncbi:hypothetical protein CFC21_096157 [Triticum aestivum]|uniref:DUF569 domain-containing protein n=3 Tax=Triticum TaxID=4564 RepID=A0A9R1BJE4_TRITD|nr:hypothetical protein CFC21_096157 [Triticum aestivum]VAI70470.1 unnamed protein product [Triticum turgidum subsp. durum]
MEQFQDSHHVRLRSREHGMYMHADKDGRGVSLRRPRASMNAAWAVHLYQDDDDVQYVLLHSAAYGGYLAALDAPAPVGHRGRRVEQRDYEEWEEEAVRWRPVRLVPGDYILLRHASGRFLRANGKYLPWNNSASVDDFDTVSTMTHWVVERIPARELPLAGGLDVLLPRRWIVYASAGADGGPFFWAALGFKGRSVFRLRSELASEIGIGMGDLVMCRCASRRALTGGPAAYPTRRQPTPWHADPLHRRPHGRGASPANVELRQMLVQSRKG